MKVPDLQTHETSVLEDLVSGVEPMKKICGLTRMAKAALVRANGRAWTKADLGLRGGARGGRGRWFSVGKNWKGLGLAVSQRYLNEAVKIASG